MNAVQIVEGDARDIARIMPIMDSAFDPAFGEAWTAAQCLSLLAVPGSGLLMAVAEGQMVGFALSRWILDEEELLMIGVKPPFQRKGVAAALLRHVIARAEKSLRNRIFLEVRSNNPALHFYRRFGFEHCGTRKSYYRGTNGDRFDAATMALIL